MRGGRVCEGEEREEDEDEEEEEEEEEEEREKRSFTRCTRRSVRERLPGVGEKLQTREHAWTRNVQYSYMKVCSTCLCTLCSAHTRNLHDLEIALCNLRIFTHSLSSTQPANLETPLHIPT